MHIRKMNIHINGALSIHIRKYKFTITLIYNQHTAALEQNMRLGI